MKTFNQITKKYFFPSVQTRLEKFKHSYRFLHETLDYEYKYKPYYDEINGIPVYYYICDGRSACNIDAHIIIMYFEYNGYLYGIKYYKGYGKYSLNFSYFEIISIIDKDDNKCTNTVLFFSETKDIYDLIKIMYRDYTTHNLTIIQNCFYEHDDSYYIDIVLMINENINQIFGDKLSIITQKLIDNCI